MTNYAFRWPPELDQRLREMWPFYSLWAISREFHLSTRRIRERAKKLGLPIVAYRDMLSPSKEEWVRIAREKAVEAKVRPSDVMAGCRHKGAVLARWKAWEAVLRANPHYSIAGVARISGYDHTAILNGLNRLAGAKARETRKSRSSFRRRVVPVDNFPVGCEERPLPLA